MSLRTTHIRVFDGNGDLIFVRNIDRDAEIVATAIDYIIRELTTKTATFDDYLELINNRSD